MQYRTKIECGLTNCLERGGDGRLLLQRCGHFAVAVLQFVEQARVLDGDEGLVGEGLHLYRHSYLASP